VIKRNTIIIFFVSLLLVSITPIFLPSTPTQLSQITYKYKFGFPFHFIEQEIDIIVNHGTVQIQDITDNIFNPLEVKPDFLLINFILSALTIAMFLFIIYVLYKKVMSSSNSS
jgi:hypothetical protein